MLLNGFNQHVSLSEFTTFKIGGCVSYLTVAATSDEIKNAVGEANSKDIPWQIIGSGSNILAPDTDIDRAVIVFRSNIEPEFLTDNGVKVSAGFELLQLIERSAMHGLSGLEKLAGIPGTVGGAIAGNAGAYGTAISDHLLSVTLLDRNCVVREVTAADLNFQYRSSSIRTSGEVILDATFRLIPALPEELKKTILETIADRIRKHPDYKMYPTAGSYFKNPTINGVRTPAGKLIEEAGCKGLKVGGAYQWPTHANIIAAENGSKAEDVINLTKQIADRVFEKFSISLEPEVVFLR